MYAGVPPLYKITEGNGKSYKYLKDDAALEDYRREHQNTKYVVGRMKGLGEMDADEVSETLMDENTRIIKQITVGDTKKANELFEQLMGDGVAYRKKFLKEHSQEATYNAE